MAQDAQRQRQVSGQVPDDQDRDEGSGDREVGGHHAAGPAGQGDDRRDGGQVVADDDRVGGLQGQVGSGPAHGDAGVGGGQGRGVVDAVADQQDPVPGGFQGPYRVDFVRREQPRADVGDADFCCETARGARVVAGQEERSRAGDRGDPGDGPGGCGAQGVGESEDAGRDAVDQHDPRCRPGVFQPGHYFGRWVFDGSNGEQVHRAPNLDETTGHFRGHAPAGRRVEVIDVSDIDAREARGGDDGARQRVFRRVLGGGGESQEVALGEVGSRQDDDLGEARDALSEGSGLVERDASDRAELLHHDGGFDQHAVASGVRHRRQERRHGREDDRAR